MAILAGTASQGRQIGNHRRYIIGLLLCLLFFVASGFGFARTGWFLHHVSIYEGVVEVGLAADHVDADVLFVGDSSLHFGVIPTIVQQKSGLSAYNLGMSAPLFEAEGDLILDAYLARNRRPRLIVLYMAPSTNPEQPSDKLFDVVGWLWRHEYGSPVMRRFLARHPQVLYQYPYSVWRLTAQDLQFSERSFLEGQRITVAERGFSPYWLPGQGHPATLPDNCAIAARSVAVPSDYLRHFLDRYERDGTIVAIYIAPLAACDGGFPLAAQAYKGIADDTLYQLPNDLFVNDAVPIHLTPDGALRNSEFVGDFVARFAALHPAGHAGADGLAEPPGRAKQ